MTPDAHLPPNAFSKAIAIVHAGMGPAMPECHVWEEVPNSPPFTNSLIGDLLDGGKGVVLRAANGSHGAIAMVEGGYRVMRDPIMPWIRVRGLLGAIEFARWGMSL